MNERQAFKVGLLSALSHRGIEPSTLVQYVRDRAEALEKRAALPIVLPILGAGYLVSRGLSGVARLGKDVIIDIPTNIGSGLAYFPEIIGAVPTANEDISEIQDESLLEAYLEAAARLRRQIQDIRNKRKLETKRREEQSARKIREAQQLYERTLSAAS